MGWAALGGFETILVDNGGPYQSRLKTMMRCCWAARWLVLRVPWLAEHSGWRCLVTAAFCFVATFARVVAQPVASTSVIVLVIYFAGLGGGTHGLRGAIGNAAAFLLAGAWAAC